MPCYNCGYDSSVVTKDDIGWQCEWCSDNEIQSPIIKFLKKELSELQGYVESSDAIIRDFIEKALKEDGYGENEPR